MRPLQASAAVLGALTLASSVAHGQVCANPRPTDPGGVSGISYEAAELSYFDSPSKRARVHYALAGINAPPAKSTLEAGVPDAIVIAAQAAEDAFAKYEELGFAAPLGDGDSPCEQNGGSDAVDIYVLKFSAADGQVLADHCLSGTPKRCAGYMLVENDFLGGGYADTAEGMRTVVPHELFHLVQDAYDAGLERWWAEGSAQWAAKQVYPELQDLERFLPAYFDAPWRPLNVPPTGVVASFLYATAIWPVFLEERYGASIVQAIYAGMGDGQKVLDATDAALAERAGSLPADFARFASYNAATGTRAPDTGGYPDAASYPEVALEPWDTASGSVQGVMSGLSTAYYSVETSEPLEVALAADPARVTGLLIPLVDGRADVSSARLLPVTLEGAGVVVVAGQSRERTDAPFTLSAGAEATPSGGSEGSGDTDSPGSSGCSLSPAGGSARAPWANAGVSLAIMVSLLGRLRAKSRRTLRKES